MTSDRSIGLTDAMIERMLVERSGSGAPSGFVESVASAAGATPQRRAWGMPGITGSRRRALAWSLVAVALALLAAGAAIVGASLLTDHEPDRSLMLIAQLDMDRTDGGPPSISISELDPVTRERLPIAAIPISSSTTSWTPSKRARSGMSMRAIWAPDHRHALLYDDLNQIAGILDIADHVITPMHLDDYGGSATTWSPTGDRFAWLSVAQSNVRLVIFDVLGRKVREIALPLTIQSDFAPPRWSADGVTILMPSGCVACPFGLKILSVPLDGTPIRTAYDASVDAIGHADGSLPANAATVTLSRDGSTFAYTTSKGITSVAADGRRTEMASGIDVELTWSPDGRRIAFTRLDDGFTPIGISVVAADGSDLIELTNGYDQQPVWSPDGRSLAFSRDTGLGPSVWIVSVDGGPPTRLVDHARADW